MAPWSYFIIFITEGYTVYQIPCNPDWLLVPWLLVPWLHVYYIFQLIEAIAVFLYLFIIPHAPASMNLSHFPLLDSHNATTLSNSMAELKRRIRKDDVFGTSQCLEWPRVFAINLSVLQSMDTMSYPARNTTFSTESKVPHQNLVRILGTVPMWNVVPCYSLVI